KYKELDFFCSHGSVDPIIPVEWARKTPEYLQNKNISHIYNEYPVGHGVAPQNFVALQDWILKRL
ncbi:MAG: phospholipase, partial [Bacteroidota bacterium]